MVSLKKKRSFEFEDVMESRILWSLVALIAASLVLVDALKLPECRDRNDKTCRRILSVRKKEHCIKDWYYGRLQCCATCAKMLYDAEIDPKTLIAKDPTDPKKKEDFYAKLKNPPLPCKDQMGTDGISWTNWCKEHIRTTEESHSSSCSNSFLVQVRCFKSCKFEECSPPRPKPPQGNGAGATSTVGPSIGNEATTQTTEALVDGTTKGPASDTNLPLISP